MHFNDPHVAPGPQVEHRLFPGVVDRRLLLLLLLERLNKPPQPRSLSHRLSASFSLLYCIAPGVVVLLVVVLYLEEEEEEEDMMDNSAGFLFVANTEKVCIFGR